MRPKPTDTTGQEARDTNEAKEGTTASPGPGSRVKDSAQQIWLAGLGAFAKAQEEGSKVFETLVKEGLGMQRKTQAAATEATSKMASMANMAGGLGARPAGAWDKLENIFEDRVAKALGRLGMPSAQDVAALLARVEALEAQLARSAGKRAEAADTETAAPAKPRRRAVPRSAKTDVAADEPVEPVAPVKPAKPARSTKSARPAPSAAAADASPAKPGKRRPAAKTGR